MSNAQLLNAAATKSIWEQNRSHPWWVHIVDPFAVYPLISVKGGYFEKQGFVKTHHSLPAVCHHTEQALLAASSKSLLRACEEEQFQV